MEKKTSKVETKIEIRKFIYMKLHHIAIWTFRLEELKEFYVRFFGGKSNEKYINPKKGFESILSLLEREQTWN